MSITTDTLKLKEDPVASLPLDRNLDSANLLMFAQNYNVMTLMHNADCISAAINHSHINADVYHDMSFQRLNLKCVCLLNKGIYSGRRLVILPDCWSWQTDDVWLCLHNHTNTIVYEKSYRMLKYNDHDPTPLQIQERAYAIWCSHGKPDGKCTEHWDQAKKELIVL